MQNKKIFLTGELIILFVLLPLMLLLQVLHLVKASFILFGIIYVIIVTLKNKQITWKSLFVFPEKPYWKVILFRFFLLAVVSIIFMYFFENEKLFIVVKKNIIFWLSLCVFYSTISVFPQEFLYRSFFFQRYQVLFKNGVLMIVVNALIFSLAHIVFKNPLVLGITFVGGLLFAFTYTKTKSLFVTSIEHAIYGSWLFTVGMGEILAFPMPS